MRRLIPVVFLLALASACSPSPKLTVEQTAANAGVANAEKRYAQARAKAEADYAADHNTEKYQTALQQAEVLKNNDVRIAKDPFSGGCKHTVTHTGDVHIYTFSEECGEGESWTLGSIGVGIVRIDVSTPQGFKLDVGLDFDGKVVPLGNGRYEFKEPEPVYIHKMHGQAVTMRIVKE